MDNKKSIFRNIVISVVIAALPYLVTFVASGWVGVDIKVRAYAALISAASQGLGAEWCTRKNDKPGACVWMVMFIATGIIGIVLARQAW